MASIGSDQARISLLNGEIIGITERITRPVRAHPQLFAAVVVGALFWFVLPRGMRPAARVLTAWDLTTALYLLLMLFMMARSNVDRIRSVAALEQRRWIILVLATVTALVSVGAVVVEMASRQKMTPEEEFQRLTLAGLTVVLSWTFMHTMFAIHYAHEYYTGPKANPAKGLEFPGNEPPDYWDFMYYAIVIGTACATADVNITSRIMRRLTTLHCIVAFFFNTTILALTVNIGASLF